MVKVVITLEERIKKARYLSWAFMSVAIVSLFFNLLLVLTMVQMGSRVTVMTQLFNTTRGTKTLVLTDTLNQNLGDLDLLEQAFVRRFIEERNFLIQHSKEMQRRWGPYGDLALMTTSRIWRPVYRYDDERIKKLDETFPTHADNINIESRVGHNWKVNFDLWSHTQQGMVRRPKTANVRVAFSPARAQKVAYPGYYYNPLGMVVVDYFENDRIEKR